MSIKGTSFFNKIENIWDEIAHILRKRAYEMKVGTLGFIFRYQKSTLQCPRKSVSHRECTFLARKSNWLIYAKYPRLASTATIITSQLIFHLYTQPSPDNYIRLLLSTALQSSGYRNPFPFSLSLSLRIDLHPVTDWERCVCRRRRRSPLIFYSSGDTCSTPRGLREARGAGKSLSPRAAWERLLQRRSCQPIDIYVWVCVIGSTGASYRQSWIGESWRRDVQVIHHILADRFLRLFRNVGLGFTGGLCLFWREKEVTVWGGCVEGIFPGKARVVVIYCSSMIALSWAKFQLLPCKLIIICSFIIKWWKLNRSLPYNKTAT